MTIQSEVSKAVYVGDGISKSIVIPFYFFENQIAVYKGLEETPLIEGKDYTVSGAGHYNGGEVTLSVPPEEGEVVTVARHVDLKQLIAFLEGEDFPASDYEYALDKITMALQELREVLSRAVVVPRNGKITPKEVYEMMLIINEHLELILQVPELAARVEELKTEVENLYAEVKNLYDEMMNNTTDAVLEGDTRWVTSGGVYNHLQESYYDKETVDSRISASKPLQFLNVELNVMPDNIKLDDSCLGFPYQVELALDGVTSAHIPTVSFNCADATSGRFAPVADAYDGGVRLYLKDNTAFQSIIPSIVVH